MTTLFTILIMLTIIHCLLDAVVFGDIIAQEYEAHFFTVLLPTFAD